MSRIEPMAASLSILVAEDEPLSAMALQAQLEALGHSVVGPAHNGHEAVAIARDTPVDLAILDVRMPGISGVEAAQQLATFCEVPVILLSGYSDPDLIEGATHAPVFHYLVKPVSMADLGPAIAVAMTRYREWREFRGEALELEQKIADRKTVEQAKGLLMSARGVSEAEAYHLLQKESQNRNQPMAEIARSILMTESLLHDDG
jgi:AmiR/NasT family two-component response regulator